MNAGTFAGTVAGPDQPVVNVTLRFAPEGVVAECVPTGQVWRWRYETITLRFGGFDGSYMFLASTEGREEMATSAEGSAEALRAASGARFGATIDAALRERARAGRRSKAWFAILGMAVVGLVWALFQVPTWAAEQTRHLPMSVDRQLGDAAYESMELPGEKVEAPAMQAFLDQTIARLARESGCDECAFRIDIVRSDQLNAFALPGGQMVILTGLLDASESPEEVIGVLAHEMAHVTRRHGVRQLVRQAGIGIGAAILLGDSEGIVALAASLAISADQNAYSREEETDADEVGVSYLVAAGIDPVGMARTFERFAEQDGGVEIPAWFSTHPDHASRIAMVRRLRSEAAGQYTPIDVDWAALKASLQATPALPAGEAPDATPGLSAGSK